MNIKLAFTPVSRPLSTCWRWCWTPRRRSTRSTTPWSPPTWRGPPRASARRRSSASTSRPCPRAPASGALVVYWSPLLKGYNLWENLKTFTARALRLARDYRSVAGGPARERPRRGAPGGQGGGGRHARGLHLRQVPAGEGRVPEQGGPARPPRPPRSPGGGGGAQGPLRLGLGEREPRPRPHQRAGGGGDAGGDRGAGERSRQGAGAGDRGPGPGGAQGPRLRGPAPRRPGQRQPAAHGHPAPRPAQAFEGDDRARRQGHHLRLRRHQPEARRQDVGDEGRHGGGGGRALHACARWGA